jgi:dTDP-4-amino-4,6-dideoxygalactose transaminase
MRNWLRLYDTVILDAAHNILNPFYKPGLSAHAVCYSFGPLKQITTGRGGAVVGPFVAADRRRVEAYIHSGTVNHCGVYKRGRNLRMTEPAAALGLAQLRRLPEMQRTRKDILQMYESHLPDTSPIKC